MRRLLFILIMVLLIPLAFGVVKAIGDDSSTSEADVLAPDELLRTKYPAAPSEMGPVEQAQELAAIRGNLASLGVTIEDPVVTSLQPITYSWRMVFDSWERYLLDTASINRVIGRMKAAGTVSGERVELDVVAPNGVAEMLYFAISPPLETQKWGTDSRECAKEAESELIPLVSSGLAERYGVRLESVRVDSEADVAVLRMKLAVPDGSDTDGLSLFIEEIWNEVMRFNSVTGRIGVTYIEADDEVGRLVVREAHDYVMGRVVSYSDTGYLPAASRVSVGR